MTTKNLLIECIRARRGSLLRTLASAASCCAALWIASPVAGQSTATTPPVNTSSDSEQPVAMSAFEVITTQGHGYISNNTAEAFKTNESLMDIPQIDVVVTRDMINDIGQAEATEVLQYFGLNSIYANSNDVTIRGGSNIVTPFVDEMPTGGLPYGDNAAFDSYEVIKGPAQVLYASAALGGIVLESTKKPLPYRQDVLSGSVNSFGTIRAGLDSTGPVGMIGDARIGYRFVGSYQRDQSYFVNVKENSTVLFPEFQVQLKNTTVRIYDLYLHMLHTPEANGNITASGDLYTGMGWKNAMNMVQGTMEQHDSNQVYIMVDTKLSDNWENRFAAEDRYSQRYGANAVNIDVDYIHRSMTYIARLNDIKHYDWNAIWDTQGHYNFGQLKQADAFGWAWSDSIEKDRLWSGATGATPGFPTTSVSIDNPAAYQALVVPAASQYSENLVYPNIGSHNETQNAAIYGAHFADIIPGWLTLSGGLNWGAIATYSTGNTATLPYNPVEVTTQHWSHRIGAILRPFGRKDLSIYALESTTFSPVSGGQLLANGQLPPSQVGKDDEFGFKTALFGGKISSDFAVFHMTKNNQLNGGGVLPNGQIFYTPIGNIVQKGIDGDIGLTLLPGWQLIGTFFAGSNVDINNIPVPGSYPNSWTVFTRYDFAPTTALKGFGAGGGFVRLSGQYVSWPGYIQSNQLTAWQNYTGLIHLETGSLLRLFASYSDGKHWTIRVSCDNVLNEAYPTGSQVPSISDPSEPMTFTLSTDYRF